LASGLVRHCIYGVDAAEEDLTMWQRSDVLLVVMEKQPLSSNILGEQRTFIGKECAETLFIPMIREAFDANGIIEGNYFVSVLGYLGITQKFS